jgi:O-antigen ligase
MAQTANFQRLVVEKFFGDSSIRSTSALYSKADRINTAEVAFNIATHNPILGVGISNYARHYIHHNHDPRFRKRTNKVICNNVYLEIFSETGIFSLVLFLLFLYTLYKKTKHDDTGALRIGLIALMFYFLSFPTFTMLFIWVFWGLIISLPAQKSSS